MTQFEANDELYVSLVATPETPSRCSKPPRPSTLLKLASEPLAMTVKTTLVIAAFFAAGTEYSLGWLNQRNAKMSSICLPHVFGKVLDVGCNDGLFASQLMETSTTIESMYGIDPYLPKTTYIPVQVYDGVHIPFADKAFDVVLCSFMLHHAKDAAQVLREAKRVGKRVVILEDYVDTWLARWTCLMVHLVLLPFFPFMAFDQFRTVAEWEAMFQQTGLNVLAKQEYTSAAQYFPFLRHVLFVVADENDKEEGQELVQVYKPGMDRIDIVNIVFSMAIALFVISRCVSWVTNAKPHGSPASKNNGLTAVWSPLVHKKHPWWLPFCLSSQPRR